MKKLNGVGIEQVVHALKCQAIADALGYGFEFQSNPKEEDLDALIASDMPISITDDTQMTLFGFQAYLDTLKGTADYRTLIKRNYLYWYDTQCIVPKNLNLRTGLMQFQSLYRRRAPGGTCLSALQSLSANRKPSNSSTGCGTVMRGLPFVFQPDSSVYEWASALTHGGLTIRETAKEHHAYLRKLATGEDPSKYIHVELEAVFGNGGWSAKPCFEIAGWAVENCYGNFHTMLQLSILHSGDSDSTGAVAGAMYGLLFESEFPEELDRLYNRIVEKDAIDHIIKRIRAINCTAD